MTDSTEKPGPAQPTELRAGPSSGLRSRLSLAALVLVNLLPLAGVIWLEWDVAALVILYWSENLILGFYTLVKMLLVSPLAALPAGLFFLVHFGGFCAVHGLFILALLVDTDVRFMEGDPWPFFLIFLQLLLSVVLQVLALAPPEWLVVFAGMFLSHGISLVANFLVGGERRVVTVRQLMGEPYGRIAVLHFAIILGGFAVAALGQRSALLILLVLLKLAMDISLHRRQHAGYRKKMASGDSPGDEGAGVGRRNAGAVSR
jgi:hypothetical protein